MAPRTLGLLGHQQGDDADLDLRPPHHPGRRVGPLPRADGGAAQGRGRLLRPHLRGPRRPLPAGAVGDRRPPRRSSGAARQARRSRSRRRSCSSSTPTACAATWSPTSIPLDSSARAAPRPRPRHLRPHALGPRPRVHHRRAVRRGPRDAARHPRRPARHLLRHDRRRVHVHRRPASARRGCRCAWRSTRNYPAARRARAGGASSRSWSEAESFERFLHAKYVGHKRFSLEGGEALIPLLDRVLNDAAREGVREVVIGMPHRGRLNVLANTVGQAAGPDLRGVRGQRPDPDTTQGSGDVKYHLGASRHPPGGHRGDDRRAAGARTRATSSS